MPIDDTTRTFVKSIQIGIADGRNPFKSDSDRTFDDMDEGIAAESGEQAENIAEDRHGELPSFVHGIA